MNLIHRIIDKLQETFPANRIVVLLTPIAFMPLAGTVTAFAATYFPGLELSEGLVVGLSAGAALSAVTLAYKWLDQWQRGENINAAADVETALEELADERPEMGVLIDSLGTLDGIGQALENLRARIAEDSVSSHEVAAEIGAIIDTTANFLEQASPLEEPEAPEPEVARLAESV